MNYGSDTVALRAAHRIRGLPGSVPGVRPAGDSHVPVRGEPLGAMGDHQNDITRPGGFRHRYPRWECMSRVTGVVGAGPAARWPGWCAGPLPRMPCAPRKGQAMGTGGSKGRAAAAAPRACRSTPVGRGRLLPRPRRLLRRPSLHSPGEAEQQTGGEVHDAREFVFTRASAAGD